MIKIKFVGTSRTPGLIRPDQDSGWFRTPVGAPTKSGSGPVDATCLGCAHVDLTRSKWSDRGRACVCLERERLSNGKAAQEIPLTTPACSRFLRRANVETALAAADRRLDAELEARRVKIGQLEEAIRRLRGEIREIQLQRQDPGEDTQWVGFEPERTTIE